MINTKRRQSFVQTINGFIASRRGSLIEEVTLTPVKTTGKDISNANNNTARKDSLLGEDGAAKSKRSSNNSTPDEERDGEGERDDYVSGFPIMNERFTEMQKPLTTNQMRDLPLSEKFYKVNLVASYLGEF